MSLHALPSAATIEAVITGEGDADKAWTQIWLLTQKKDGKFLYYLGLQPAEREALLAVFRDLLDYGGGPGETPTAKASTSEAATSPTPKNSVLHNRANYSMGGKNLWIDYAEKLPRGKSRGEYANSYPRGAIVHWTAGRRNGLSEGGDLMRETGMLYLLIDSNGKVGQSNPLNEWGYHAGASSHPTCSGLVSDELVGIEVQAGGNLTKKDGFWRTWFGESIPEEQVAVSQKRENIQAGAYHSYTPQQVSALRRVLCWLHLNNPGVFSLDRILGHDEVSPGRKSDPGAAISVEGRILTMREFRDLVKEDVSRIKAS